MTGISGEVFIGANTGIDAAYLALMVCKNTHM